jgi:hypothetical protein
LHTVLAVRCESDLLLHHIAAIGLAACRGTALLVDLDAAAPSYPGRLTVADLVRDGVRRSDLAPAKRGVAVLGRGGADIDRAVELVDALAEGWPAVAVRVGDDPVPFPVVPVSPVFPAHWERHLEGTVAQSVIRGRRRDGGEAVVLPPLSRSQVRAMLAGNVRPRWRWVRAWSPVWDMSWD